MWTALLSTENRSLTVDASEYDTTDAKGSRGGRIHPKPEWFHDAAGLVRILACQPRRPHVRGSGDRVKSRASRWRMRVVARIRRRMACGARPRGWRPGVCCVAQLPVRQPQQPSDSNKVKQSSYSLMPRFPRESKVDGLLRAVAGGSVGQDRFR